jgi:hypothetical protein
MPRKSGRYLEWAAPKLRVLRIDPLRCSCGGRLRLGATVMDGAGAQRYLRGTGLATGGQLARPPPGPSYGLNPFGGYRHPLNAGALT